MKLFCLLCFFICLFQQIWACSPSPGDLEFCDRFWQNLLTRSTVPPQVYSSNRWITYGSKLLKFHIDMYGDKVSFRKASANCHSQGGSLVSIQSMKENRYLMNKLQYLPKQYRPNSVWIGFYKSHNSFVAEATFKWTDGSTPQILNWGKWSPEKHYQERCVAMSSSNGQWFETDCSEKRTYICEKPRATPKPTIVSTKPTTGTPTPTTVTPKLTTVTPKPTTVTPKPTTVTPSQTTVTRKSTTVTPKPTTVTPSQTTVTRKSTTVTPSPTTVTPKSTTVTPKPTKLTPTPTTTTSMKPIVTVGPEGVIPTPPNQPTTVTTSPTTVTTSPTTVTPSPTTVTPSPTTVTPKSTTVTPSPTTVTPKSTTVTPKPTKLTPTPTTTTSMKPIVTVGPEGVIPTPPNHKPLSVILTKMSNYSGSHEQPQEVTKINTFLGLTTVGLVGIIIAIIIVFAIPMVGLIVWKKGRMNKLKTSTGFDNSLYQYDTQLQSGQFVPYDRLPEAK